MNEAHFQNKMKTVGEILKNAREAKGLTHTDVYKFIKIHPRYLSALETNDYKVFSSGVHLRGFLRLYAALLEEMPLGLNILEAKTEIQRHLIVNAFIALLYKLYDPNRQGIMGPLLERAIRNVMLTAMEDKVDLDFDGWRGSLPIPPARSVFSWACQEGVCRSSENTSPGQTPSCHPSKTSQASPGQIHFPTTHRNFLLVTVLGPH